MNKYLKAWLISASFLASSAAISQNNDFSGDFDKEKPAEIKARTDDVKAEDTIKKEIKNPEEAKHAESVKKPSDTDKKDLEKQIDAIAVEHGFSDDEALEELTKAVRIGNSERIDAILTAYPKILNKKDKFGNTPLYNAIFADQYLVTEVLLKRKADIKLANVNGDAPIHRAAQTGNVKIIGLLLKSGAAVWTTNAKGESPLAKAASSGQLEAVKFLLENKAEINTPDSKGDTPLHRAAIKGEKEIVKYLLDKGADPNLKNKDGQKPADLAKKNEIKELLSGEK